MNPTLRTLLVIDDSLEDRELYRRYLLHDRDYSYTFVEAELAQQGLDLWQQHRPDAVLLDYRLPDLDGVEFLAQLQAVSQQHHLPVVVVTGQGNEAIAVQAIKSGAQDYLVKGHITPEGLQSAINAAVSTVQLHTQLQQCVERERLVAQIMRKIHRTLDLEEILQTTVDEVRQFLHTDRVLIFRLQSDGWGTVTTESVGPGWTPLLSTSYCDPCLNEAYLEPFQQGLVTIKSDIYDGSVEPCHVELLTQLQVRANLVVPILQHGQLWGMVIVHHCAAPRQWQPLEVDLLNELATQVGIALQQAELYQQAQDELAERRRVEAELRESEERLRSALTASRMGTWDWNIQTGEIRWSDNLEAMFGWEPGAFDGSFAMFANSLHPDDRDRVLATINHAVATGENYDIEFRIVYPDGRIRWALSQGQVFYDADGRPLRMAGSDIDITERKHTAESLRESEERFRQLAENIDAVFWIKEAHDDQVIYVSPAYERLWHLNRQELYESQRNWVNYIHPDDREATDRAFQTKAAIGQFDEEYRIVLPDGQLRWVRDRCFPLTDDAGNIYRFAGIAEDITERKRSEQVLRDSEERLQMALEGSGGGLWDWNIVTGKDYFSPAWLGMLGYQEGDLPGEYRVWEHLIHPDDYGWMMERLQAHLRDDSIPYKFEYRLLTKSGTWKWIANYGKVVARDAQGNPVRMAGIHHDIDDRKQIEEALRANEQLLRLALTGAKAGSWDWEIPTGKIAWSPENYDLYGLDLTTITPQYADWYNALHPDDRDQANAEVTRVVEQRLPELHLEFRIVHPQRGVRWLLALGRLTLDDHSNPIRLSGINLDISDRKQAEREREELLEREQAARAEAERANRIKDEFLAVLSHELRSPLNPILGWTKLMQTGRFDAAKTTEALATIERNVRLQTQLIDDLLDVAKILRGKLSMTIAPVDLVLVIEAAIDTVKAAAIAKNILIHPELPHIGYVAGDAARLQQILWNLLSNAVKFTPDQGRVEIQLSDVRRDLTRYAQVTVRDTGKGIKPDFLPHIFDSFRQEDVSTTRQYGGLGLGLAIVRNLVEAHGGTIWADSQGEGQGATFTMQLPLLPTEPEGNPSNSPTNPDRDQLDHLNLTGIRILIVDDEPDTRELLAALLTQYGAEVVVAATAADVLITLAAYQPDVLISDIGMPNMDGYSLIQQIRTLPPEQGGQIPAIALTAYARENDQHRAIQSGFQRHVTKPLEPEQLVQAVTALIHQQTPNPN